MERELFDAPGAAEYLGLSASRIRQLCNTGGMGEKVGSRWVIRRDELDAYAKTRRPVGRPPESAEVEAEVGQ